MKNDLILVDANLFKKMVRSMGTGSDESVLRVYKQVRKKYDADGNPLTEAKNEPKKGTRAS